jgi:hypothetical protein
LASPGTRAHCSRLSDMDPAGERALEQVEIAEAELALLMQEPVLRDLLNTAEPTMEATARLQKLRDVVARLSGKRSTPVSG